jgi:hypothetical protein
MGMKAAKTPPTLLLEDTFHGLMSATSVAHCMDVKARDRHELALILVQTHEKLLRYAMQERRTQV